MNASAVSVVLIEEKPELVSSVRLFLSGLQRSRLQWFLTFEDAQEEYRTHAPQIVILSGSHSPELVTTIRRAWHDTSLIVLLRHEQSDLEDGYRKAGASTCIVRKQDYTAELKKILTMRMSPPENPDVRKEIATNDRKEFEPDQQVLHYKIEKQIARGGMGQIFRARDLKLKRTVALKVLRASHARDAVANKRILREARAVSSLTHPNIVTVYAIEELDGQHFIVMEFVEGKTLTFMIEEEPLEIAFMLDVGIQICGALEAAHPRGIIHRDIKPSNVMVTADGVVKLLDFGLVKNIAFSASDSSVSKLTASGLIMGTFGYMSPEQIRGEELDARTDIYSLGCLLYQTATGKKPIQNSGFFFDDESTGEEPAPPSFLRPEIPPEFDRIVRKAMANDKSQRFASATEVAKELKKLKSVVLSVPRPTGKTGSQTLSLFRKGSYLVRMCAERDIRKGIDCFGAVIAQDGDYAPAYAGLAEALALLGYYGYMRPSEFLISGKTAVRKSLDLDPSLARAQSILGFLQTMSRQWNKAKAAFENAVELSSRDPGIRLHYALYLLITGKLDEAERQLSDALEIDPVLLEADSALGQFYFFRRQYDQSIAQFSTLLELQPQNHIAHFYLGLCYEQQQNFEQAVTELRQAFSALKDVRSAAALAHCYVSKGDKDQAPRIAAQLDAVKEQRYVSPCEQAIVWAGLGEPARSLNALEQACEERSTWLLFMKLDPRFDMLRRDARFKEIEKRAFPA